jgi:hypothetical protein
MRALPGPVPYRGKAIVAHNRHQELDTAVFLLLVPRQKRCP